jgi:hypothetical protein
MQSFQLTQPGSSPLKQREPRMHEGSSQALSPHVAITTCCNHYMLLLHPPFTWGQVGPLISQPDFGFGALSKYVWFLCTSGDLALL